jgi:putative phage-type endonuclease
MLRDDLISSYIPWRKELNSTHHQLFHVLDLEQGTEEWLDWRHSGIGASEASTVMGDNRFQSSSELLYQKRNKINTEPNEKMRLGTSLEQDARDLYIEETGMPVEPLCLQSKEHSWLIASMDGITDDYGHIVEIKCGKSAYWQANKGKVPSYYYGQLQHQLMITGLDSVDYWCYWPGYKGILQTVTRDKPYTRRLLRAEMEFMEQLDE